MSRRIRVRAVPKEKPNYHLYVLALIALARQLEASEQVVADAVERAKPKKAGGAS